MKRGMLWPAAVAGVLCLTIAANVWLITIANNDPSFAVEQNYYQRGLHWDDELAQRAHNAELGWKLLATLEPIERGLGAELRIALTDSRVAPIRDASVVVRAVHVARANDPVEVTLESADDGHYRAIVPLQRAGLWELRIAVHRGPDVYTAIERMDARSAHP
jgi:nitrogen fixation protein FixH